MTFEEWWEANKHMLPNIVKIDAREAFGAATKAEREACANWLRQNANAEKDPNKRAAFIEAHNAILARSSAG